MICPYCKSDKIYDDPDTRGIVWCKMCEAWVDRTAAVDACRPRVVWARSKHLVHTAEIPKHLLLADGTINDPQYAGFKWEPWP